MRIPFLIRSVFPRPEILGNKDGKSIAEILYREIGKGINFYSCREGRHDRGAEAVDQTLDSQNTQIHNGLLQTGQEPEKLVISFMRDSRSRIFLSLCSR